MDELTTSQLSREHLALLFRLTKIFNSSLHLETVLNQVMDETIAAVRAERGFIMLRDERGRLEFQTARGMSRETIDHPEFEVSRSVVETVARTGEAVFTSDAQEDARFLRRTSVIGLGLRSILCVPLQVMDIVTGVMYVDNRLQAGIFKEADLELLTSIASSAAVAIENARLYQVALEKARMEKDCPLPCSWFSHGTSCAKRSGGRPRPEKRSLRGIAGFARNLPRGCTLP
ncbi:MAG TPA: GAF domain-containing protein [Anaerolineales bacterium]|nr:GAF domain-containing protein [Anaerolineales bacterium]